MNSEKIKLIVEKAYLDLRKNNIFITNEQIEDLVNYYLESKISMDEIKQDLDTRIEMAMHKSQVRKLVRVNDSRGKIGAFPFIIIIIIILVIIFVIFMVNNIIN